jgi:hypothetical protein
MPLTTGVLFGASNSVVRLAMTAWAAFRERQSRSAREIQIEAIRFASPGMAAAFDITLTNRSGESIRVDKIYIASPTGST